MTRSLPVGCTRLDARIEERNIAEYIDEAIGNAAIHSYRAQTLAKICRIYIRQRLFDVLRAARRHKDS